MSHSEDDLLSQEKDDDELTLPRASINKMIKELVSKQTEKVTIRHLLFLNKAVQDFSQDKHTGSSLGSFLLFFNACLFTFHVVPSP